MIYYVVALMWANIFEAFLKVLGQIDKFGNFEELFE